MSTEPLPAWLAGLNDAQLEAARTLSGPLLVLAGAGTGKTSVFVARAIAIVRSLHVPPRCVLGVTFTRRATEEMRRRVADALSPAEARQMSLGTMHNLGL